MTQDLIRDERRYKAAMIVRMLQAEGASLPLDALPDDTQVALTHALGRMKPVNRAERDTVAEEFAAALEDLALTAPADFRAALHSLEGQLSDSAAARLADEAASGDPAHAWHRLACLTVDKQIEILLNEGTEIAALLLSKLPVERAAELLTKIPGPRARQITCISALLDDMQAETAARIAAALVQTYCVKLSLALDDSAVQRVAAQLDATTRARRDEILTGLDEDDPSFAQKVRKAIFVFGNIPERINKSDVVKILKQINAEQLAPCIGGGLSAGAEDKLASEFLLENVPNRLATQIKDEIEEAGAIPRKIVDEAQSMLIKAIRDLADAGEITMKSKEEAEEGEEPGNAQSAA